MKTPVLLKFEPSLIVEEPPSIAPPVDKMALGPAQYYIHLYPPHNNNLMGKTSWKYRCLHVGQKPVPLMLEPSIGFGVNCCYIARYYEYRKVLVPEGDKVPPIRSYLTKIEYWRVPAIDGSYYLNPWQYDNINLRLPIATESFLANGLPSFDLKENNFAVQSITETLTGIKLAYTQTLQDIVFKNPVPVAGTELTLNYIEPIQVEELVYFPDNLSTTFGGSYGLEPKGLWFTT